MQVGGSQPFGIEVHEVVFLMRAAVSSQYIENRGNVRTRLA